MIRFKRKQRRRDVARGSFQRRLQLESLEDRLVFATMDLAQLRESGAVIFGAGIEDESGISVSNAGDINGDGYEDILIGARRADAAANAKTSAGEAYVVFGKSDWSATTTVDLANLGTAGVTFFGADERDYAGRSVSAAGDVNGDGFDDLLIGAVSADAASNTIPEAGESYIVFGKGDWSNTPTVNLGSLGAAGVVLYGINFRDYSGRSVSAAGDVNGDGFDDVLIGVHYGDAASDLKTGAGETALVFGRATWQQSINLSNLGTGGVTIFGAEESDASGFSVSGGGDVNGDGFDDLLIGARFADALSNNKDRAGDSYIVFGKQNWSSTATIDLASLGSAGVTIFGADEVDFSGVSVSGVGDVNGDGFDDVLIGAEGGDGFDNETSEAGDSYLLFGKENWPLTVNLAALGNAGVVFHGVDDSDSSGMEVGGGGDINGDGLDDLIIGARYADAGVNAKSKAGDTYVLFGRPSWSQEFALSNLSNSGITLFGADVEDYSGLTVSHAGDVNGDGFDDWLIGAPGADGANNARSLSGETYLVFGDNRFTGSVSHLGDETAETLTGNTSDNVMVGGQGNDLLVGQGGEDSMRGGQGHDILAVGDLDFMRLVGGRGNDTVRLDGSGLALNLIEIPDNRIMGIEQINLTGSGPNSLTLDLLEVLNISNESNRLVVFRDGNDVVNRGTGWTQQANQTINGVTFEVFTQDAATLLIQATFADINVTNTPSATTVVAGTTFTYVIVVTNAGPAGATNVRLTDTLAPGVTFDPINSSGGCTATGQIVNCNIGALAAGASATRNIVVRLAASAAHGAVLTNVATVTNPESDPTVADRTASSTVTVARQTDMRISATASADPVTAGTGFFYTADVSNQGPSDASNVLVRTTLPAGLTFLAATSSASCSAAGQVVTCTIGTMIPGSNASRQIGVLAASTIADAAVVSTTLNVQQSEADPTPADNSDVVDVTINRRADLKIVKVAPANPVLAGGSFSFTLQVSNSGPSVATGVNIADALPPGLTFDAANSDNRCSAVGQDVTCNLGQIAANANNELTLHVLVGAALNEGELITNSASIDGSEHDPSLGNNTSVVGVTVTRNVNPLPWQNSRDHRDVNNDQFVTPIDVLRIINELNNRQFSDPDGGLRNPPPPGSFPYLDVTGDNFATPLDALNVINFLNANAGGQPEGEGESADESVDSMRAAAWFAALADWADDSDDSLADSDLDLEVLRWRFD